MIEVKGLTKGFGDKTVLKGVSFTVPPGQICGYLGPNGAGKTTTVKILTGVMPANSGSAVVAGFDICEHPIEVKKRIGYVPEAGTVYSTLSALEYLTLVGALHGIPEDLISERCYRMLELFGILDAANGRLATFSKGMRQKVIISASLMHDPDIILFDEPLSGLDVNAARIIKNILKGLAERGKTVLYCSHILDVVERLCDRVIILNRGEIVADGPTRDLITSAREDTLESVFRLLTASEEDEPLVQAFLQTIHNGSEDGN